MQSNRIIKSFSRNHNLAGLAALVTARQDAPKALHKEGVIGPSALAAHPS
jgi:hypothetical protein